MGDYKMAFGRRIINKIYLTKELGATAPTMVKLYSGVPGP